MARTSRELLFGTGTTGPVGDIGLLILRVFAGLALAFAHGINKIPPADGFVNMIGGFGFPAPAFFAWMSGIAEFIGGMMVALGLLTRPFAVMVMINMTVALIFAHAGDDFAGRELPLLFLAVFTMFAFMGAGRYSADWMIPRR